MDNKIVGTFCVVFFYFIYMNRSREILFYFCDDKEKWITNCGKLWEIVGFFISYNSKNKYKYKMFLHCK